VAAIGVRVRRWVSMHGLALNVRPRMEHFGLIVPCGLVGRRVTSLAEVLGEGAPTLEEAHSVLGEEFVAGLEGRLAGREGRVGDEPRGLGTA
jgi:lipoyl(octanoyl) transferase